MATRATVLRPPMPPCEASAVEPRDSSQLQPWRAPLAPRTESSALTALHQLGPRQSRSTTSAAPLLESTTVPPTRCATARRRRLSLRLEGLPRVSVHIFPSARRDALLAPGSSAGRRTGRRTRAAAPAEPRLARAVALRRCAGTACRCFLPRHDDDTSPFPLGLLRPRHAGARRSAGGMHRAARGRYRPRLRCGWRPRLGARRTVVAPRDDPPHQPGTGQCGPVHLDRPAARSRPGARSGWAGPSTGRDRGSRC